MEETFKVIVDSLGHSALTYIPDVHLVRVYSDEVNRTAHLEICLHAETPDAIESAIDGVRELRGLFMDDLSLSYSFGVESQTELSERAREQSLDYAR